MKTFFICLALACPASALPGLPSAIAQKKYDVGDYGGAASLYQKMIEKDPGDPALHYDLGNALFKAGRLGQAIASYQRAFNILPRDSDIKYNLNFALKRSGEELVPSGVPPVFFSLFYLLSERELAGLHWLSCWAALLLASALLHRPPWRERLRLGALGALIFWFGFSTWWLARRATGSQNTAVIIRSTAEIRSGPSDNFSVGFTAPEGRRVQILSESGSWLEIGVLKEGAKGWLKSDDVEKI